MLDFRDDWRLLFDNARTYNQEGSWVYVDAEEMEKVFDVAFNQHIAGTGLPGAPPGQEASSSMLNAYDSALTPMDEDERLPPKIKNGRRMVMSDDEEYLTPSEEE